MRLITHQGTSKCVIKGFGNVIMGQSSKALNLKRFAPIPPVGGAAMSSFMFSLIKKRLGT